MTIIGDLAGSDVSRALQSFTYLAKHDLTENLLTLFIWHYVVWKFAMCSIREAFKMFVVVNYGKMLKTLAIVILENIYGSIVSFYL